jgi:hypothetical protein
MQTDGMHIEAGWRVSMLLEGNLRWLWVARWGRFYVTRGKSAIETEYYVWNFINKTKPIIALACYLISQ